MCHQIDGCPLVAEGDRSKPGTEILASHLIQAFVMIAANVLVISTMRIQGKSLISGTSHDEMVESFGITWLLAGTALGHIVGAGAILGIQASGAI